MHPSLERLTHLSPRSERSIPVHHGPPVPVYFIQVPQSALQSIQGSFAPPPPIWPGDAPVDRDGERTWRIVFINNVTVYIRSQPVPNDPPGLWAVSPSWEEIFIPQSLLGFEIRDTEPPSPPMPPASAFAGPENIPTLMSPHGRTTMGHAFRGRRCKVCGGGDMHDMYCPSIHPGFSCQWCLFVNGVHSLGCSGFAPPPPPPDIRAGNLTTSYALTQT